MSERLKILAVGDIADASEVHVGDDAMLLGLLRTRPFAELAPRLTIVAGRIDAARDLFGSAAIPRPRMRRGAAHRNERSEQVDRFVKLVIGSSRNLRGTGTWIQLAKAVKHADALLVSGGGSLNSTWDDHIALRLALVRAADAIGQPIVVSGQTIGPHFVPPDREAVAEIIESSRWFGVRERSSELLARSLTSRGVVRLGADDAMFLDAGDSSVDGETSDFLSRRTAGGDYVAVTLDAGAVREDDVPTVAHEIADIAIHHGLEVVFVPHVRHLTARSADDVSRSTQLMEALPRDVHSSIADVTVDDAARFARHAAVIVTSRYHPLVFGLGNGVPGMIVSQDDYTLTKCAGVAELFGLAEWNVPSAALMTSMLSEAVGEVIERRHELSEQLQRLGCGWRAHSELRAAAIVEVLKGASPIGEAVPEIPVPLRPNGTWAAAASIITAQGITLERAQTHQIDTESATRRHVAELIQRAASADAAALEARLVTDDADRENARLNVAHGDEHTRRLDLERELADMRSATAGEIAELRSLHAELHETWLQTELDLRHAHDAATAQRQRDHATIDHLHEQIRGHDQQAAGASRLMALLADTESSLEALRQTKTFRFTARPRAVYSMFRRWRRPAKS